MIYAIDSLLAVRAVRKISFSTRGAFCLRFAVAVEEVTSFLFTKPQRGNLLQHSFLQLGRPSGALTSIIDYFSTATADRKQYASLRLLYFIFWWDYFGLHNIVQSRCR